MTADQVFIFEYEQADSQRLDRFLVEKLPEYSRSFLQNLIKDELVWVDGEIVKKTGSKLESSQTVEVHIPPPAPSHIVPEQISLDIVFENEDLLVINKPAGMVVHPAAGHHSGTLANAVLGYAPDIEGVGGERRPGLVHRLDKDTSGVIVVAKNDAAHRNLQKQFKDRTVEKVYLALVQGHPPTPQGRIEAAVGRDPRDRKKMAVMSADKGRMAITEYQTLSSFSAYTLVEVKIHTGRTHQIRVHMAYLGCPVVGDLIYGQKKITLPLKRQFLHATKLGFQLPGEQTFQIFEASLPNDLQTILDDLE